MNEDIYEELKKILPEEQIKRQEPMRDHTTFRIGGPASLFVTPRTKEEIRDVIICCRSYPVPYYIIGNGSNLLVSDAGYDGVVIQLYRNFNQITVKGQTVTAYSGALLSTVAAEAYKASLTGLEFASGIPGTLGGACVMNAGAYGGEMKDVLSEVEVLMQDGKFQMIPKADLKMGYRTSVIAEDKDIVLNAAMELKKGDREEISARMDDLKERRQSKQPLEYPSAGSTFKRPEGYYAGKLIQDAGLRGFTVGGAQVSEKHCGFVINRDHATAADVDELMRRVQETVEDKFGVKLEPEVKRLGEF